jgi:transposase
MVEAVLQGMPKAEAARTFWIGISTAKRYVGKVHKGEDIVWRRPLGKTCSAPCSRRTCAGIRRRLKQNTGFSSACPSSTL